MDDAQKILQNGILILIQENVKNLNLAVVRVLIYVLLTFKFILQYLFFRLNVGNKNNFDDKRSCEHACSRRDSEVTSPVRVQTVRPPTVDSRPRIVKIIILCFKIFC
jgi:hypothetical protein